MSIVKSLKSRQGWKKYSERAIHTHIPRNYNKTGSVAVLSISVGLLGCPGSMFAASASPFDEVRNVMCPHECAISSQVLSGKAM